jgi:hypothetical protein
MDYKSLLSRGKFCYPASVFDLLDVVPTKTSCYECKKKNLSAWINCGEIDLCLGCVTDLTETLVYPKRLKRGPKIPPIIKDPTVLPLKRDPVTPFFDPFKHPKIDDDDLI